MNKTVVFLGVLCAVLLGSNAYLLHVNQTLIERHRTYEAAQLPTLGSPIKPIMVRGTQGAERPLVFDPDARHPRLLLIVSPDCPYCEKNWPMWDTLIKGLPAGVNVTYFDVTGKFDERIAAEHDIRDEQLITASLDSAIQARIVGTPTTILIARDGTVGQVWRGVLSEQDVGEVLTAFNR